jgi:hypothetical protein
MLTHIEPDDVTSNDDPDALYQVTNDVNESGTDVNVLFRAVGFISVPLPSKPLPEVPLVATPTHHLPPFLLELPLVFMASYIGAATASSTPLCVTMSVTVRVEHHTHAACVCGGGVGGEEERERERESEKERGGREKERERSRDHQLTSPFNLQDVHKDSNTSCDQHDVSVNFYRVDYSLYCLIKQYPCNYPDN